MDDVGDAHVLNYDELIIKRIIYLDKGSNDDDLDPLYKGIQQSIVLKKLYLSDIKLTLADGKLTDAIAKNSTIKVLHLSNINISDEGVKHLANILKENNTITHLSLGKNNIGDEGAKYLADMLAVNKTLQLIALSNNNIRNRGAQYSIATSLVENTSIHTIYLHNNKISSEGAEKLVDTLESNHSIKVLYLNNNNISKDVMDRIKAILDDKKKKKIPANKVNDTAKKDKDVDNNQSGPPNTNKRVKIMSVQLDYEHTHCSICASKFSADLDSTDDNIRKYLPVLSSSKTCDHYFCHGCVLNQQTAIAEENSGRLPKWIPCMVCKTKTAFCPSEPKYHRLLIDILKKAEWVDAPQVKDELAE